MEMGFDAALISEALMTLRLDGSDTSAQTINQCATWMIDHIEARPSGPPPTSIGLSILRGGIQDIRNYFTSPSTSSGSSRSSSAASSRRLMPVGGPLLERPTRSMQSIIPPWVSSFQGSLTPIQTRSSSRGLGTFDQDLVASIQGSTEQCGICLQRVAMNLRDHIFQNHKGCGLRLAERSETCGELTNDNQYWLCGTCIAEMEISYSNFCILSQNRFANSTIKIQVGKRLRGSVIIEGLTETNRNGALDLSVKFEDLAPFIGLSSCNKVQCVRDSQIGDLSLGLASIQDPRGPLRKKDDDLVADTILEKASDWTSPKSLLTALLQRLVQESALPFANQIVMAAMKIPDENRLGNFHEKWMRFLGKCRLLDVGFLFKLLVFWSRNIWKRSQLSEGHCKTIRKIICSVIGQDANAKSYVLKICTQNLMNLAMNQGSLGFDQATCSLAEDVIKHLVQMRVERSESNQKEKKDDSDDNQESEKIPNEEIKLYDALACVVLSSKNSRYVKSNTVNTLL